MKLAIKDNKVRVTMPGTTENYVEWFGWNWDGHGTVGLQVQPGDFVSPIWVAAPSLRAGPGDPGPGAEYGEIQWPVCVQFDFAFDLKLYTGTDVIDGGTVITLGSISGTIYAPLTPNPENGDGFGELGQINNPIRTAAGCWYGSSYMTSPSFDLGGFTGVSGSFVPIVTFKQIYAPGNGTGVIDGADEVGLVCNVFLVCIDNENFWQACDDPSFAGFTYFYDANGNQCMSVLGAFEAATGTAYDTIGNQVQQGASEGDVFSNQIHTITNYDRVDWDNTSYDFPNYSGVNYLEAVGTVHTTPICDACDCGVLADNASYYTPVETPDGAFTAAAVSYTYACSSSSSGGGSSSSSSSCPCAATTPCSYCTCTPNAATVTLASISLYSGCLACFGAYYSVASGSVNGTYTLTQGSSDLPCVFGFESTSPVTLKKYTNADCTTGETDVSGYFTIFLYLQNPYSHLEAYITTDDDHQFTVFGQSWVNRSCQLTILLNNGITLAGCGLAPGGGSRGYLGQNGTASLWECGASSSSSSASSSSSSSASSSSSSSASSSSSSSASSSSSSASCPTDNCVNCCIDYTLTIAGETSVDGTYTATNSSEEGPLCDWEFFGTASGHDVDIILVCDGTQWTLYIEDVDAETAINWAAPIDDSGCPPITGWTLTDNACGGTPELNIIKCNGCCRKFNLVVGDTTYVLIDIGDDGTGTGHDNWSDGANYTLFFGGFGGAGQWNLYSFDGETNYAPDDPQSDVCPTNQTFASGTMTLTCADTDMLRRPDFSFSEASSSSGEFKPLGVPKTVGLRKQFAPRSDPKSDVFPTLAQQPQVSDPGTTMMAYNTKTGEMEERPRVPNRDKRDCGCSRHG